jgi:hypothetical protein
MINIAERPAEAEAISSSADDVNACPQADRPAARRSAQIPIVLGWAL